MAQQPAEHAAREEERAIEEASSVTERLHCGQKRMVCLSTDKTIKALLVTSGLLLTHRHENPSNTQMQRNADGDRE